jgi:hypothetical protein
MAGRLRVKLHSLRGLKACDLPIQRIKEAGHPLSYCSVPTKHPADPMLFRLRMAGQTPSRYTADTCS